MELHCLANGCKLTQGEREKNKKCLFTIASKKHLQREHTSAVLIFFQNYILDNQDYLQASKQNVLISTRGFDVIFGAFF